MATIEVNRNYIASANESPDGTINLGLHEGGLVALQVAKPTDGTTATVYLVPAEAEAFGVMLIRLAALAAVPTENEKAERPKSKLGLVPDRLRR